MKYKEWLNEWLELYVKPTVKIRTYEKYILNVTKHIQPALGGYEMEQLTAETLQKFVVGLNLAPNTVNGVVTVLQKSLKTAVAVNVSERQYADNIKRPRQFGKQVECFSVSEQKKIENAVIQSKKPKMFGVVLCLYTGLRIGELLALQWGDIDLKKCLLYVNKSCHWGRNERGEYVQIIDTPKTAQSDRVIPIPRQLMPYIRQMKKDCGGSYVIGCNGKPVQTRSYQRSFELLLKQLNIPRKGFHSLRHTFATRALECGMDVKTLSEILGHKNSTITLNRYCHSLIEHKSEMMNKLGKMFGYG